MTELEKWNEWLLLNKQIDLSIHFEEYKKLYIKPKITLEELLRYLAMLHIVQYYDLVTQKYAKSRGGSNNVARARGHLIKYIAENNIENIPMKTMFLKVFGINRDHSVVSYWKEQQFIGSELSKYKTLCNFIENHEIEWKTLESNNN